MTLQLLYCAYVAPIITLCHGAFVEQNSKTECAKGYASLWAGLWMRCWSTRCSRLLLFLRLVVVVVVVVVLLGRGVGSVVPPHQTTRFKSWKSNPGAAVC